MVGLAGADAERARKLTLADVSPYSQEPRDAIVERVAQVSLSVKIRSCTLPPNRHISVAADAVNTAVVSFLVAQRSQCERRLIC